MRGVALLLAAALAASPAMAQQASLTVVNRSGETIEELYVSTPDGRFGDLRDWLGEQVLPDGQGFTLTGLPPGRCLWDAAVVFAERRIREWRNLNICRQPRLVVPPCDPQHCRPRH